MAGTPFRRERGDRAIPRPAALLAGDGAASGGGRRRRPHYTPVVAPVKPGRTTTVAPQRPAAQRPPTDDADAIPRPAAPAGGGPPPAPPRETHRRTTRLFAATPRRGSRHRHRDRPRRRFPRDAPPARGRAVADVARRRRGERHRRACPLRAETPLRSGGGAGRADAAPQQWTDPGPGRSLEAAHAPGVRAGQGRSAAQAGPARRLTATAATDTSEEPYPPIARSAGEPGWGAQSSRIGGR